MASFLQFPPALRPGRRDGRVLAAALTGLLALAGARPALAAPARPAAAPGARGRLLQDITVAGRVTNRETGEGLPGVTVLQKGSSNGVSTNADGSYTLTVPEGSVLVFSSVGFVSQQIAVTSATLDVGLAGDSKALSEIVVVGYGTQTRQELTTAVSSVKAQDIERQTVAGFDQALQGQTPGVQVTSPSGQPGAGLNVRIRGNNSPSLTGSPLYVIDGVPILPSYDRELSVGNQTPNPLNAINPNDIESIDVLKDGAAAAIYGVRASNGVVVITTKHGKVGKAQLGFNFYVGRQQLRKKIDMLNGQQFAQYFNEAQDADGISAADKKDPTKYYPSLNNLPNTDWQDEVYRTATIQNYQLNVSGGTDKTRYYVAGGYFKQDGILINSGFDRYNFKVNLDQQIGNRFRVGTNLNLSRTGNNGSVQSEARIENGGSVLGGLATIPTLPVYNPDGSYSVNPFQAFDNPVGNLLERRNRANIYQVIGNVYGELDILKNLTFRSSLGIDFRTQLENEFVTREYPGTKSSSSDTKGSARTGTNQQTIWLSENTLTYNPTIGEKLRLTLLGGYSVQASDRFTSRTLVQGFASNAAPYLGAATKINETASDQQQWGLVSYFSRAILNFDERYLATLSFRADQSSRFRAGKRTGYFPAVGLGWRIAKESFFPENNVVSDLKLRASYGENGNQEIPVYARFSTYGTGASYQGYGSSPATLAGGINPDVIGNPDVTWETTKQFNLGLDIGLVENRATLTLDAYRKRTTNLLFQLPLAYSTGANVQPGFNNPQVIQNLGEVQNQGLELGLNTSNVRGEVGAFSWTTNLNFTLNRNEVKDIGTLINEKGQTVPLEVIQGGGYSIVRAGDPLGAFYGYKVEGIYQSAAEIASAPKSQVGGDSQPGDIRFKDLNGDGVINDKDRTIIGNPNPKSIAGVTNTFGFKGLELSVFFQGSFGNDIYNENRVTTEGLSEALNQTTRVLNRWTPTNTNTDIPRAVRNDPSQNRRFSDRFVEDGSYVRLKNLTLAYNLPLGLISNAKLSNLRIYATGLNLLTWTHYLGYDPEVSADPYSTTQFGRDLGVYPQARSYTVGINATF